MVPLQKFDLKLLHNHLCNRGFAAMRQHGKLSQLYEPRMPNLPFEVKALRDVDIARGWLPDNGSSVKLQSPQAVSGYLQKSV